MKPMPQVIERRDAKRDKARKWQTVRNTVLRRDGYACRACGLSSGQVDVHHKKLRSAGGADGRRARFLM